MSATATEKGPTRRGTTNQNVRGNTEDRRRRREYLVETFRADALLCTLSFDGATTTRAVARGDLERFTQVQRSIGIAVTSAEACRCYRCGFLLTVDTVTVDRIIPGCKGGTYRRSNIRPACEDCNSETGGGLSKGGRGHAA